uniref:Uncharacterized protein n=1 Tax=Oryza brachyantha TaxID=4533 RepID=J3LY47_ORYBR
MSPFTDLDSYDNEVISSELNLPASFSSFLYTVINLPYAAILCNTFVPLKL